MNEVLYELSIATYLVRWGPNIVIYLIFIGIMEGYLEVRCGDN